MPHHKDLTGADLHEPKGIDSASVNTVYLANGTGGGAWGQIPSSTIDPTTVKNLNREQMFGLFFDIGTAGSRYLGFAKPVRLVKVVAVPQSATAGAATVLTLRNDAGTSMGTINIPNGAPAGMIFTLSPASNNTFVADTKLQIDSDGGTSTNTNMQFTFELEWI